VNSEVQPVRQNQHLYREYGSVLDVALGQPYQRRGSLRGGACSAGIAYSLLVALSIFSPSVKAADTQIVKGICTTQSHIADGGVHEDLRLRRSRFFCDAAVISFFDDSPDHIMLQFVDSKSHHSRGLGFAGIIESDGQVLDVSNVYLEPAESTKVVSGSCKFYFKDRHMQSIACGARIEEGDRATAPVVVFIAAPGQ
jgi:hypothetical protein